MPRLRHRAVHQPVRSSIRTAAGPPSGPRLPRAPSGTSMTAPWAWNGSKSAAPTCDSHLGHVFEGEGYGTPTDQRYCINSVSLKLVSADDAGSSASARARAFPEGPRPAPHQRRGGGPLHRRNTGTTPLLELARAAQPTCHRLSYAQADFALGTLFACYARFSTDERRSQHTERRPLTMTTTAITTTAPISGHLPGMAAAQGRRHRAAGTPGPGRLRSGDRRPRGGRRVMSAPSRRPSRPWPRPSRTTPTTSPSSSPTSAAGPTAASACPTSWTPCRPSSRSSTG